MDSPHAAREAAARVKAKNIPAHLEEQAVRGLIRRIAGEAYAAREWSGLLGDFYRPRWESYIRLLRISLLTGRPVADYSRYDAEYFFTTLGDPYPTEPSGDPRTALNAAMAAL